MSDSFQRRMRRRARIAVVARVLFAIFGVIALGRSAALWLARGCGPQPAGPPVSAPRR